MSLINYKERKIHLKVLYYGPGLAGKMTSIDYVHRHIAPDRQQVLDPAAIEPSLALDLGTPAMREFRCWFHLHTIPGPLFHDPARRLALRGVDGLVFVADSQSARLEANVGSLEELETNLAINGYDFAMIPMVFQYNKRDLPEIVTVTELDTALNSAGRPRFEAVATRGVGVFEALTAVANLMFESLRK